MPKERLKMWWAQARAKAAAIRWPQPVFPPWAAIVAAVTALAALVIIFWDWNILRRPIEGWASAAIGRDVTIGGDVDVDLSWTSRVTAERVSIANPDWAPAGGDMARIDRLTFDVRTVPLLLTGALIFPEVEIERPMIELIREKSGRANWRFGEDGSGAPLQLPLIGRLIVSDGRVHIADQRHNMVFAGTVESHEGPNGEAARAFVLKGVGTLDGHPFTGTMTGDSPLRADATHPYVFDARLVMGPNEIAAKGNIPRPFDLGAVVGTLEVSGNDMADLYYITGLAFPNTPPYRLNGRLTRMGDLWRVEHLAGSVGHSDLAGKMAVDATADRPFLRANLWSKHADVDDLATLLGARPNTHPAPTPASTAAAAGEHATNSAFQDSMLLLPDAPLHVERVRHMDARVRYVAHAVTTGGVPMRDLSLVAKLDHGVLTLDPASVRLALGKLAGRARIDARQDIPDVDVAIRLTEARLEQFFHSARAGEPPVAGDLEMTARLHGRGLSVHRAVANASGDIVLAAPHGEIRQSVAELLGINVVNGLGLILTGDQSTTELRCAVADFHADNGRLTARRFVLDTGVVLATGTGQADLRNETMDLRLEGHAKKFRIGRVMAPITIKGPWAHPHIGVEAGKAIAQLGVGGVLGAVISPVAALLPFITTGSTRDVDCTRLLAGGPAMAASN